MPEGLALHSDWRLCPSKNKVCSSGVSPTGWFMNWPMKHPVPTGLCVDETQLHGKAGICLCFPHKNSTTEEGVLLFEAEKSFGENKILMMVRGESSSFEEFGKALVVFPTFDVWFEPDPEEDPISNCFDSAFWERWVQSQGCEPIFTRIREVYWKGNYGTSRRQAQPWAQPVTRAHCCPSHTAGAQPECRCTWASASCWTKLLRCLPNPHLPHWLQHLWRSKVSLENFHSRCFRKKLFDLRTCRR